MSAIERDRSFIGRSVLIIVTNWVLVSCALFPDPGTRIANDIRDQGSTYVQEVAYTDDSGPVIEIVLVPGSTFDTARQVACEVALPAVERGDPPEGLGVVVEDLTGDVVLTGFEVC